MFRIIIYQNGVPIDHSACDEMGVVLMSFLPRIGEDLLVDDKLMKVTNIINVLAGADYDARIDIVYNAA